MGIMKKYNLYNLLLVEIEAGVVSHVVNSIDFQLNYFSFADTENREFRYSIQIHPFCKFNNPQDDTEIMNYNLTGKWGKYFCDKSSRLAIEYKDKRISIWCDDSNFLITLFIQTFLLGEGYAFIHSAGVVNEKGEAILFTGAGGVGKTALVSHFVKNRGYKILGDDIIAIGKSGDCLPFPRSMILKDYHRNIFPELLPQYEDNKFQKTLLSVKQFIRLNAPFREVIRNYLIKKGIKDSVMAGWHITPYLAALPVEKVFGPGKTCEGANVKAIYDVVKSGGQEFKVSDCSFNDMSLRINSIIQFEWLNTYYLLINMGIYKIIDFTKFIADSGTICKEFLKDKELKTIEVPENASSEIMTKYINSIIKE